MNTAQTIAAALLDSSAEDYMKSYWQNRPMRWEFIPSMTPGILEVNRWTVKGTNSYIGSVRQAGDRWWTHTVAPRHFYGQTNNIEHVRHPYVSHEGPFKTKEEAAEKLWEFYEARR